MFVLSCSSTTNVKYGSLSGRVILVNDTGNPANDPVDFSGVTVALYHLAELDTTIIRINQEYPNIGVRPSQEMIFNHQDYSPVSTTSTYSDGRFIIKKIPSGNYNIVFSKNNWGNKYVYNAYISDDNLTKNNIFYSEFCKFKTEVTDTLYRLVELNTPVIDSSFIFGKKKSYYVMNDIYFTNTVFIEKGTQIFLGDNVSIYFHGECSFIDTKLNDYTRITSYSSNTKLNKISFHNQNTCIVKNIVLTNSIYGLVINNSSNINIRDNAFFNNNQAIIIISDCTNTEVSNNLFFNNINPVAERGIIANNADNTSILNNVFINNSCVITTYPGSSTFLFNSYFESNFMDYYSSYNSTDEIRNNIFSNAQYYSIGINHLSSMLIHYNNFNCIKGIIRYPLGILGSIIVSRNNIYSTSYAVNYRPYFPSNPGDLNCTYNYFGTVDEETICDRIWDQEDWIIDSEYNPNLTSGHVIFTPYLNAKVSNAGLIRKL